MEGIPSSAEAVILLLPQSQMASLPQCPLLCQVPGGHSGSLEKRRNEWFRHLKVSRESGWECGVPKITQPAVRE